MKSITFCVFALLLGNQIATAQNSNASIMFSGYIVHLNEEQVWVKPDGSSVVAELLGQDASIICHLTPSTEITDKDGRTISVNDLSNNYGVYVGEYVSVTTRNNVCEKLSILERDVDLPLHDAISNSNLIKVLSLVKQGANIDEKDANNIAPLLLAIELGRGGIAKYLIEKGADINISDNNGTTPLHIAAYKEIPIIARLLLSKGAKLEAGDKYGHTALFSSIFVGNVDITELLVASGANINARGNSGETPLMMAAQANNIELVKLLLDNNADVNSRDEVYGYTALDVAKSMNNTKMIEILKEYGADPE